MTSLQSLARQRWNPFARLRRGLVVLVLTLALASPALEAQQRIPGDWIGLGPEGAEVVTLAASTAQAGLVWAAVHDGGVFESTDGGDTWEPARGGLEALSYLSLAADPVDPRRAYVGTSQGLWETSAGGDTWTRTPLLRGFGLSSIGIATVAVAPSDPDVLIASGQVNVQRSLDRGHTWRDLANLPKNRSASQIVFDPRSADTFYVVGSFDSPVKTTDGGATFTLVAEGLEDHSESFLRIQDLVVSPSDPDTLYVSLDRRADGGVFRTTNGGASWSFQGNPFRTDRSSRVPDVLAVDPTDADRLLAGSSQGLALSTDGGVTWQTADLPATPWTERNVLSVTWVPGMPGTALAGTESGGVFRTDDGALSWTESNRGLDARPLGLSSLPLDQDSSHPGLVVDPRWTGRLYALSRDYRLYASSNWGQSWQRLDGAFADGGAVVDFRLDPSRPDLVFARVLVRLENDQLDEGLYRSRDAGATWTLVGEGLPNPSADGFDTHGPLHWNRDAPGPYLLLTGDDVYRSTDDGGTWSLLYSDLPKLDDASPTLTRLAVAASGQRLFLWLDVPGEDTCQGLGCPAPLLERRLYESQDGGDTWTELDPVTRPTGQDTEFVAQGEIGVLYQVRDGDLYRSADSGASYSFFAATPYEPLGSRPSDGWPAEEIVDPTFADVVYQARFGWPVRRMVDSVWQNLSTGLPPVEVGGLVLAPYDTEGPRLLLAVTDSGLWARPLEGSTFPLPAGEGITDPAFPDFRFWFRIDPGTGGPAVAGQKEERCLPGTVCASGAVPGRVEVLARVVGPRPNGFLWPTLVRFTTSEVQVWIQQISTEELRHYTLPRAEAGEDELDGLFDRTGFTPNGSSKLAGPLHRASRADTEPPPAGDWLTTPELPGFRFKMAIGAQGTLGRREGACLAETLCASGALAGRSEVLVRVVGPRPNGFLWPTLVKLTPAPVDVWIERTATGEIQHYQLPGASPGSDVLDGLFDREGFPAS